MVRIIDYKTRQKEDGTEFYLLEVQGGIEMVKSKETGLYYMLQQRKPLYLQQTTSSSSEYRKYTNKYSIKPD